MLKFLSKTFILIIGNQTKKTGKVFRKQSLVNGSLNPNGYLFICRVIFVPLDKRTISLNFYHFLKFKHHCIQCLFGFLKYQQIFFGRRWTLRQMLLRFLPALSLFPLLNSFGSEFYPDPVHILKQALLYKYTCKALWYFLICSTRFHFLRNTRSVSADFMALNSQFGEKKLI